VLHPRTAGAQRLFGDARTLYTSMLRHVAYCRRREDMPSIRSVFGFLTWQHASRIRCIAFFFLRKAQGPEHGGVLNILLEKSRRRTSSTATWEFEGLKECQCGKEAHNDELCENFISIHAPRSHSSSRSDFGPFP